MIYMILAVFRDIKMRIIRCMVYTGLKADSRVILLALQMNFIWCLSHGQMLSGI